MATYSKIPKKVKSDLDARFIGRYCVFSKSLASATTVANELNKQDVKSGIPAVGFITLKGQRFYYCRVGFYNDKDIYAT